jgi:ADP-ribose pyrophosphatase YjhB (NUDIX family)
MPENIERTYPDRPIVGVGAVVVCDSRVLVVRRATEPLKGEWSVPGGMLELGEKLKDGIVREVLEETGVVVEPTEVLDVFDSIFADPDGRTRYHYVLIDYLCRVVSGDAIAATDVSEVRWVSASELDSLKMRDVTATVIRKGLTRAT